jgi:hypothetical protein
MILSLYALLHAGMIRSMVHTQGRNGSRTTSPEHYYAIGLHAANLAPQIALDPGWDHAKCNAAAKCRTPGLNFRCPGTANCT